MTGAPIKQQQYGTVNATTTETMAKHVSNAVTRDAPPSPEKEVCALSTEDPKRPKDRAAFRGVPTLPRSRECAFAMERRVNCAVVRGVRIKRRIGDCVKGMEQR